MMQTKPKILVVGSFVMDLIVSAERFVNVGETIIGCGFSTAPGGKGANQAIQAARVGAQVTMAGKVGNDDFGRQLIASAQESGVDTKWVRVCDDAPSAIGNVQLQVTENGTENRIVVVPGANMKITEQDIADVKAHIGEFDMVILQNEIPMEINISIAKAAKAAGVPIMLNPAPYAKLPAELLACLTYISPNEHEAADIVNIVPDGEDGIKRSVEALRTLGVENVLITLGKNGSIFSDGERYVRCACVDCGTVVDPTAAGDSFMGAFCTAVAGGAAIPEAMQFASCTAGITVSRMGAQTSLPTLNEVLAAMQAHDMDTTPFAALQ